MSYEVHCTKGYLRVTLYTAYTTHLTYGKLIFLVLYPFVERPLHAEHLDIVTTVEPTVHEGMCDGQVNGTLLSG